MTTHTPEAMRENCEARCDRLNAGLAKTGQLRDDRSSFPVPEDRHG